MLVGNSGDGDGEDVSTSVDVNVGKSVSVSVGMGVAVFVEASVVVNDTVGVVVGNATTCNTVGTDVYSVVEIDPCGSPPR